MRVLNFRIPLIILTVAVMFWDTRVSGFYVPGVAPTDFKEGGVIDVKAIKMTSSHTQLPYEYDSLPFCEPPGGRIYKTENLGEILRGDRIGNTAYKVQMNKREVCKVLCDKKSWDAKASGEVSYRIQQEYFVHLIIDNLPCATQFSMPDTLEIQYEPGKERVHVSMLQGLVLTVIRNVNNK